MTEHYRFTIEHVEQALAASSWCAAHATQDWEIYPHWPSAGYTYIFHSLDDAARFVMHCIN